MANANSKNAPIRIDFDSFEDLFTTQDERDNGMIKTLNISEIVPFKNHTFKVNDDAKMYELVESIENNGVVNPVIVFTNEDGQYEMISGHRRMRASELAGLETIPAVVKKLDRDEATVIMVETNLQNRDVILPSEKAFSYKAMYDAIKRQAGRPSKNKPPVEANFQTGKTSQHLEGILKESKAQIERYISITKLIPELMELVDNAVIKEPDKLQMALRPAVEISQISHDLQRIIYAFCEENELTPSHAQAIKLKDLFKNCELDENSIEMVLSEEKPNQKSSVKITIRDENILKYKGDLSEEAFVKKIIRALDFYERKQVKEQSQERDK